MKSEISQWKIDNARTAIFSRVSDAKSVLRILDRPEVRDCVRAFNGKVVNKRFFDALAVATGNPPKDYESGCHTFGDFVPRKYNSGPAVDLCTNRGNIVSGFGCATNAQGRLDADKTLELIEERIANARKVADTDWNGNLAGLVEGLNRIGEQIDALKGAFDVQLWYDLGLERLLLFC